MRVLVTGAAGFIGSHLSERLIEAGHEVTGLDDLSTGHRRNIPESINCMVVGDVTDPGHVAAVMSKSPDVVYHCAASYRDPDAWERDALTNVLGTVNVIQACQAHGVKRLIYLQTSLCYGQPEGSTPLQTWSPLRPRGSYAITKTAAERFVMGSDLTWLSFRLANVYGPRNLSGPVPAFYKRLRQGEPCTVVGSRRDFIYVNDLVDLLYMAAWKGRWGVYHASSGKDQPILAVYDQVRQAMGANGNYTLIERGPDDAATLLLSPAGTLDEFNWKATTPLSVGIRKAVEWYDANTVEETYTHLREAG